MNHTFRLIWSAPARQWIPVAEESGGSALRTVLVGVLSCALGIAIAGPALAAPTGAQITAGRGSVTQTTTTTTISQSSEALSLNWQSFNVASNETVNFVQPNASAIAVNRILSNAGTEIFGHINANGQVWLINPNGILFGAGSQVNVGGLTASTLAVNDVTLGSSTRTFGGPGTGIVVNQGSITAAEGGYVALLGNQVLNEGLINAQLGTVALGAGSAATLTFSGRQLIHLQVDQSTLGNLAENRQLIEADGGRVIMTAGAQDSLLASVVNDSGVIEARTVENHEGTITLLAGMRRGTVEVGGVLDATAPAGLSGGAINTSAATVSIAAAARIKTGAGGSWLIDPTDLTIDSAAATVIDDSLSGGTSVTEQTTATTASGSGIQAPGTGSINVDAPLTWTNAAATLTLSSYNAINVNAAVNGAGPVVMQAGVGNPSPTSANLTIASGASVTAATITLAAANNFINQAGAGALTATSGRWLVNSTDPTLDTDGGLVPNFVQYAASLSTTPAQTFGNGFLYSVAPTITVTALNGTPSKVYDGTASAALAPANYSVTGLINGDAVTAMNGTYQSTDVGNHIIVTSAASATDLTVDTSGNIPVYGYALATPVTAAIGSITPATLTASIVGNPTKVYDATTTATLSAANYALSGFVLGQGATVNQPSSVAYDSPSAGSRTITASFANTNFAANSGTKLSNYILPTAASGAGTVQPAPLEIQGVLATGKVYDATTTDPLNTTQASLYGIIGSDSVALSTTNAIGNFASSQVGNARSVTASGFALSGAQQADYVLVAPAGLSANITPASLTVSGVAATGKVYDGTTTDVLNINNAALSGVLGSDAANLTLASNAVTGTFATRNVGTNLSVAASGFTLGGSAASNYTLTQPGGLTADITPATLSISLVGNPTKLYNGTTTAALSSSNFSITGFLSGDGATLPQTTSAQYDSANAGTRTVTATLAAPDFATANGTLLSNYSFPTTVTGGGAITPAPLAGSLIGNPTKLYDGNTSATLTSSNYSLTGFLAGEGATVSQATGAYASANAGVQTVSATLTPGNYTAASGTLLSNYVLPTTLSGPGTITQAPLGDNIYAGIVGNPTKTYDGNTTATLTSANFQLLGFISGQGATVTQTTGQYASANAGTQQITAALSAANFTADSGTNLANYQLPSTAYGTGTISTAQLTATIVGNPTRVYNGSTSMVLQSSNYAVAGFVSGEGAVINPSALINYASANVGTQSISAALTSTAYTATGNTLLSNYTLATSASGTGTITPAPVYAIGIYGTNKVYDTTLTDPLNTAGAGLAGVVSSDASNLSLVGNAAGAFSTVHVGNNLPVTVTGLSLDGSAATNYQLEPISGLSANITPAPLGISGVVANSKPYDATNAASLTGSAALVGLLASDSASVSSAGATAVFSGVNVGNNLKVTATGFSISGGSASDYLLSQPTGLTANITPAPITALITGNPTKVYDGSSSTTLTANNYTLTGFVINQGATVPQSATANYAAADASTNVTVNSTLVLSDFVASPGTSLSNYQLPTTATGTGTITQAPLNAALAGNPTKVYDGTTTAALTSANYTLAGFVVGQSASVTQTGGVYASANAGGEPVTVNLSSPDYTAGSGTNLQNYLLPTSVTGAGTITRAPLTVLNTGTTARMYDGTTLDTLTGAQLTGTVYAGDAPTLTNTASGVLGSSGNVGTDTVTTNFGLTGTGSNNYVVSQPSGLTAVISPAPLTATSNVTKTYDGGTSAVLSGANTTLSGFVPGQGATVNSGVTGNFANANVGTGLVISGGALSAGQLTANNGTLLSNYSLPASDNGTGTINPATLTYTATLASSQYGTTPIGLTGNVTGFVNGENLATATTGVAAFSTLATSASNAGHYAIDGSGLSADNGNYVFVQAPVNATALTITPAPLSVINVLTTNRLYNGSTADALSGATLVGTFYNGDAPTLTNTASGTLSNNGNVGTDAVTTNFGLTGTGSGNYSVTQPSNLNAVISAVALTATSTATKVYDGTTVATLSGSHTVLSGFISGQGATVNSGVTGTFSSANVGNGIAIVGGALTTSQLTPTAGTVLANYSLPTSDNGSGSITPKVVSLTGTRVYDAATDAAASVFAPSSTVNGVNGETLILGGSGTLAGKNVGSESLTALGTLALSNGTGLASNYTLIGGSDSVTVTHLGLTVTGTAANKVYDATTTATGIALASTGVLAGDTLSFADTSSTFASKNVGNGIAVTISGITASGSAAGNYAVNASTTTAANITPATLNLVGSRVYDAATDANAAIFGASGTLTGVGSETLTLTGAGTLAAKNAGTETLASLGTLALSDGSGMASNYTLSGGTDSAIVSKLGITVTGSAANKVYDANTIAGVTLASSGVLTGDVVNFADTSATFANKNVGTGKVVSIAGISDSGVDAGNYTLNNTSTSTTANITPLGLTVTGTAANKVYDANATATVLNLASSGILAGDVVNFADTSASFADKNVGNGKSVTIVGISKSGADAGNYALNSTTTNATANITPLGITVTGTAANKVYDATTMAGGITLASSGVLAGDIVQFTDTSANFANKNVGTGKAVTIAGITASGVDAANYTLNNSLTNTLANITPLGITVTGTAANKVYDATTTANGVILASTGVLAGDGVSFADTSAHFADKNVGISKAVAIAGITDSGTDAGNYTLNNAATITTASITPLGVSVSGTVANKVYDANTAAVVVSLASNGILAGDTVNFTDTSAAFANKNVGTGKAFTIFGITASGADAGNYTLNSSSATSSADITPLGLTVSATGVSKVYNGSVSDAVTLTSVGVLAGDSVIFAAALASFADKNVGTGKLVNVAGITDHGIDAGNYTLNNATTTTIANLTPLSITVSGTAANKVYDASTAATGVTLASSGVIPGDTVNFADASARFTDKNVGAGKAVIIGGITDSGADAGNYLLNNTTTTATASITPLSITVNGTAANKIYDATTTATGVSLASNGILAGDSVTFADSSANFADKNLGSGKSVSIGGITASGVDGANYSVNNTASTTADITPAVLTETAGYFTVPSGETPHLTGTVSGFAVGDTLANATSGRLTWTTSTPLPQKPGVYAVDGSGLSARNYVVEQAPENRDALTVTAALSGPLQHAEGLTGVPLGPDPVATPYGVGSANAQGNYTGNARRDNDPTDTNRRVGDFSGRVALRVVGVGVRLPAELHE